MMMSWYKRLVYFATLLALCVIVLGAYVRLTDAGLGCPDWPGCYGSLLVPETEDAQVAAEAAYPERPLEAGKAWREMIHRYAAATLGLAIIGIALLAWMNRRDPSQPVVVPVLLVGVVIFQGLLGMWTVTLLLKPVIVMGHLLGGLATLGMLFWLLLELRRGRGTALTGQSRRIPWPATVGLIVLVCQIALGGWTSANYAALACPDLPTCQGQWVPDQVDFEEAFVLWRGIGIDYEFGVLEAPARVAIHYTHRIGALLTFCILSLVTLRYLRLRDSDEHLRTASFAVVAMLIAQVSIGIAVVWFGLPLVVATAHNAVAALLLLSMINLNHAAAARPA